MKTSELSDAALDWAVGKCIGLSHALHGRVPYTTDWAHSGPIIEREEIYLAKSVLGGWTGSIYINAHNHNCILHQGPTPLIAAMRCYVASKLGDEVEIPESMR